MDAPCTKCGAKMKLARIEPAKPGYDLRAFECTKCNNVDQYIVENEKLSPWVLVVRLGRLRAAGLARRSADAFNLESGRN